MLELKDFEAAADRLKNVIHNIPLSTSATFSAMTGAEVYLKYENQQKTGSFKVRGAYNKIMKRYAEGDLHAVVASSAGNHAQGVAFAASSVGVKSTIVMPRSTPIAKVSATQGYGADVVLAGNIYDEAYAKACEICEETGAPAAAIELPDGTIVTGKTTALLGSSAAALLTALKTLAGLPHDLHVLPQLIIEPIQKLKIEGLGNHNPRLHTDEVLIALSISAATNPVAELALAQLPRLSGCEVHSSVMLAQVDTGVFKKLGMNLTCEPHYQTKKLYHK